VNTVTPACVSTPSHNEIEAYFFSQGLSLVRLLQQVNLINEKITIFGHTSIPKALKPVPVADGGTTCADGTDGGSK
jgi:hypothetical protein